MNKKELEEKIIEQLRLIFDPEIPVNIYDLGLIYKILFAKDDYGYVAMIEMTLTSAVCPMSEQIFNNVRNIAENIDGLSRVDVNLVFDPPWSKEMASEEAQLQLGMM